MFIIFTAFLLSLCFFYFISGEASLSSLVSIIAPLFIKLNLNDSPDNFLSNYTDLVLTGLLGVCFGRVKCSIYFYTDYAELIDSLGLDTELELLHEQLLSE